MPNYLFENTDTGETIEVFQKMNELHLYIDELGKQWQRVYTVPQAANNISKIDPYSSKDFARRTADKNLTWGQIWDESASLSKAREEKEGKGRDPIKEKYFNEYSSKRKGLQHSQDTRPKQILRREKKKRK